jgi:hypothetical protein
MRATSPSGSAEFEGRISWSGELGFGSRAAEIGQSGDTIEERGEGSASDEPQSSEARERDHQHDEPQSSEARERDHEQGQH